MLGIVPAAGIGSRLQPLGGSKELLPLGWRDRRLRVVSDYVLERMALAGADRVCLVISPEKPDLLRYFARSAPPLAAERFFFAVQPQPSGLCDALFRAAPLVASDETVLIGLPDTVWEPREALARVRSEHIHLITFPVARPEDFDAVIPARGGRVARIEVKVAGAPGRRVWGAITAPGREFHALHRLWLERGRKDLFLGHLLNAWIATGGTVTFDTQGTYYWDIGTAEGYARAWRELNPPTEMDSALRAA